MDKWEKAGTDAGWVGPMDDLETGETFFWHAADETSFPGKDWENLCISLGIEAKP